MRCSTFQSILIGKKIKIGSHRIGYHSSNVWKSVSYCQVSQLELFVANNQEQILITKKFKNSIKKLHLCHSKPFVSSSDITLMSIRNNRGIISAKYLRIAHLWSRGTGCSKTD